MGYWGLDQCWSCARQTSFLLCYHASPSSIYILLAVTSGHSLLGTILRPQTCEAGCRFCPVSATTPATAFIGACWVLISNTNKAQGLRQLLRGWSQGACCRLLVLSLKLDPGSPVSRKRVCVCVAVMAGSGGGNVCEPSRWVSKGTSRKSLPRNFRFTGKQPTATLGLLS